jgi:hypothetical protein
MEDVKFLFKFDFPPTILYPAMARHFPGMTKKTRIPDHYSMKSPEKDWHMNCVTPSWYDFPSSPQNAQAGLEGGAAGLSEKFRGTADPIRAREGLMKEERSAFLWPIPGTHPFSLHSYSAITLPDRIL